MFVKGCTAHSCDAKVNLPDIAFSVGAKVKVSFLFSFFPADTKGESGKRRDGREKWGDGW